MCDALLPDASRAGLAGVLRRVVRESGADYAVRIGGANQPRAGFFPLPAQGPTLVWRAVADSVMPAAAQWQLGLGDVELF